MDMCMHIHTQNTRRKMTNAREKLLMYGCHSIWKSLIPNWWRKNLQGAFKDGKDFNTQKMFFWVEKIVRTKPKIKKSLKHSGLCELAQASSTEGS